MRPNSFGKINLFFLTTVLLAGCLPYPGVWKEYDGRAVGANAEGAVCTVSNEKIQVDEVFEVAHDQIVDKDHYTWVKAHSVEGCKIVINLANLNGKE